jgi:aminoglycoside/choline kinase family phosphotransferase
MSAMGRTRTFGGAPRSAIKREHDLAQQWYPTYARRELNDETKRDKSEHCG